MWLAKNDDTAKSGGGMEAGCFATCCPAPVSVSLRILQDEVGRRKERGKSESVNERQCDRNKQQVSNQRSNVTLPYAALMFLHVWKAAKDVRGWQDCGRTRRYAIVSTANFRWTGPLMHLRIS
jgi:hypothetical protein